MGDHNHLYYLKSFIECLPEKYLPEELDTDSSLMTYDTQTLDAMYKRGWNDAVDDMVVNIDMQEPELCWIPCSVGLPHARNDFQMREWVLTTNEYGAVGVHKYEFGKGSLPEGWDSDFEIVAWMELPRPWSAENGSLRKIKLDEHKKGHWIKQNPMVDTEECSECGFNIPSEEFETPFCPWCGVEMIWGDELDE